MLKCLSKLTEQRRTKAQGYISILKTKSDVHFHDRYILILNGKKNISNKNPIFQSDFKMVNYLQKIGFKVYFVDEFNALLNKKSNYNKRVIDYFVRTIGRKP